MKAVVKMFTSAKKFYSAAILLLLLLSVAAAFTGAETIHAQNDFANAFGIKATISEKRLNALHEKFARCASLCGTDIRFMQSIVFPEVMRYSSIKDDIEAESLRTLYVQFGAAYANFSIGLFQMKPTFAEEVESKTVQLLPDNIRRELQLGYSVSDSREIRRQRVERLCDQDWQLVYLTAFIAVCDQLYRQQNFASPVEKLQWYATVYNAGFDKTPVYISSKIKEANRYFNRQLPGKKIIYAAIAAWFYNKGLQNASGN